MFDWEMRDRAEQAWRRTLITPEGVDLNLRLAVHDQALTTDPMHEARDERQSVTAPLDALDTTRANFESTPRV